MAHKKGQGSSKNGRDSNPQMRGVKRYGGQGGNSRFYRGPSMWNKIKAWIECWPWKGRYAFFHGGRRGEIRDKTPRKRLLSAQLIIFGFIVAFFGMLR